MITRAFISTLWADRTGPCPPQQSREGLLNSPGEWQGSGSSYTIVRVVAWVHPPFSAVRWVRSRRGFRLVSTATAGASLILLILGYL